ncbi:zinc-ribbon domain-containing protein [uncultured Methanobrevibacter sp.]|uniref:zinc-ribbon domain-containing protein n=1 Tax=uncultured Methanobrevibacter sp. TaxID=253161 RepID=UPI0025D7D81D|nr:zinc-ribbon domain-containing protein [uncultured Methanobrevibacter sp.]
MTRECENCGESVEDETLFCPACGHYVKMPKVKRSYPARWIILATIIVVIVIFGAVFVLNTSPKTATSLTMLSSSNLNSFGEYAVQLKDVNGNPMSGQFIKIEVKNNTYTLKTDSNGTARMNLTLGDGSYEIKSYFKGDNKYGESHSSDIVIK